MGHGCVFKSNKSKSIMHWKHFDEIKMDIKQIRNQYNKHLQNTKTRAAKIETELKHPTNTNAYACTTNDSTEKTCAATSSSSTKLMQYQPVQKYA